MVHPLIRYRRSEELLLRWMELNAFTTVFRTHEVSTPPHTQERSELPQQPLAGWCAFVSLES